MDYKDFERLEDIVLAMRMGVSYPEFPFLVEEFHKDAEWDDAEDSLSGFIRWMDYRKGEYEKLTRDPLKKK